MLKVRRLVRFIPVVILILLASIPVAGPVLSQANTCPALVVKAIQRARASCHLLDSGQICYADSLTAQFGDGKSSLAKSGDLAPLSSLKSVQGQAVDVSKETWGVALLKLHTAPSSEEAPTLAVLGDATVTNLVDSAHPLPLATATNRNLNNLNIFAAPDAKSAIIGQLAPLTEVSANGRTADSGWIRVQYHNALGWIVASATALDSEIASLAEAQPGDVAALYPEAAQVMTLESSPSTGCRDTPNGLLVTSANGSTARLLVDGVQVDTTGAAFLTATSGGTLTVNGLTGLANVSAADKAVTVKPGFTTSVALDKLQAKAGPSDPASGSTASLTGLYASLINGQPYVASPTAPGLQIASTTTQAAVGDSVRLQMRFTGDAALCPAQPVKPQDVALVVDTSDVMQATSPEIIRAAVTGFIQGFDGTTNRVALVGFDATGRTITDFGVTSADSPAGLVTQKPGSTGTIQAGLAEALIALRSARDEAAQAIVIITASPGSAEALDPITSDVKDHKIRLIVIGVGDLIDHDLLTKSASAPADALFAANPLGLRDALNAARLSLLHPLAARDLALTYTYDPAKYALVDTALDASGGTKISDRAVQWKAPVVYDGQTVRFPLVVKPLAASSQPIGTASLSYRACDQGQTLTTKVDGPTLVAADAASIATAANATPAVQAVVGILKPGQTGSGVIAPYGETRWLLDSPGDQTVSIVTAGTKSPLVAAISGSTIDPLYRLDNYDGKGASLNVFYLPSGAQWLSLNSTNEDSAGAYRVVFNKGIGADPTQKVTAGGPPIRDSQDEATGRVYTLEGGGKDQAVTVRLNVEDKIDTSLGIYPPFNVISLDGHYADRVYTTVDTELNQYIVTAQLRGTGPYYVFVKSQGNYILSADKGDTLISLRDTLKLGVNRKSSTRGSKTEIVGYDLPITADGRYSIRTRSANRVVLSDANNARIPYQSQIKVADFLVYSYDLKSGAYRMYVEAAGSYEFSATAGDVVSNLKGAMTLGEPLDEALPEGQNFALYRLVSGTVKPPTEGDILTVQVSSQDTSGNTKVSGDSAWFESADGLSSSTMQFAVDNSGSAPILISAQQLKGRAPYRLRINGLTQYRLVINRGDQLSNDKGTIVVGQTIRDSSRLPSVITYTVGTQVGKQLGSGDTITVTYLPELPPSGVIDPEKEPEYGTKFKLQDSAKQDIAQKESYLFQKQLRIVYQLTGKAPYRLTIPNLGAYTLSISAGNKLDVDQGVLKFDNKINDLTDGPQIIQYTLDAPDGDTVTIGIKDQRGKRKDFSAEVRSGDGTLIRPKHTLTNPAGGDQTFVYTLNGTGPFKFRFLMDGLYEVSLTRGDQITLYKGEFHIGDEETVKVTDTTPRLAAYTLNVKQHQTISIDLAGFFVLVNSDGDILKPDYYLYMYQNNAFSIRQVFQLDPGQYEISFFIAGNYTIKVKDGDLLTVDKGNLFYDLKEVDTLANDKRIATYTISGNAGDVITLRASMKTFQTSNNYLRNTLLLLVDANNVPVEIQREITDYGYLLRVYQLPGPGPYKLYLIPQRTASSGGSWSDGFYPQQEFNLFLTKGDDLLFDRGTLVPDQQVADAFDPNNGTKRAAYLIDQDEGSDITLRLGTPSGQGTPPLHGEVRVVDADDHILSSTATSFDPNALLLSYHLVGPKPYRFIMDTYGNYAITLSQGDLIQNDFGNLTPDQTVTSTLKAPQVIGTYSIDGKAGDVISVKIEAPGQSIRAYLNDSQLALISPENQAFGQGTTVYVYTLAGPGPYRLRAFYPGTSPYKVTLTGGGKDILSAQLGSLTVNPKSDDPKFKPVTVTAKLDAPARFANYTFDGKDGDLITLDLNTTGGTTALQPMVHNQEGAEIAPDVRVVSGTDFLAVYKLQGSAPFALAFEATNQYTINLTAADVVRADAGPLPSGPQDKPYSNELPKPAIVAVHQLDVAPGELITLQVQNNNQKVDVHILDGKGTVLQPEATDLQNGNNVYVYIMSGVGPYTAQLVVKGKYQASVQGGNLLRVDGGTIKFNEPSDGQLADPGRVTTFTINGNRNQIVTIQLQADGQAQVGEFRDSNGKQWEPTFQFARNNQQYAVYQLSGPAPYTFTFGGKKYTLLVDSGDALRALLGDVPFEQAISSTLPAPAVTAVYNVAGQPGEQVSFQLQDRGQPAESELYDADHKPLKRDALVKKNSTAISVYTLSGKGPYQYEFLTQGPYKLTVTKDNALNAALGILPTGQKVTNTLTAPAENAIYTVDGQPGQTILIELQAGGRPQKSQLLNGQGKELVPEAKLDRNNYTYTVFTLSGPAPYTLTFNTAQQYNVTVSRSNTIRVEVGVVRFDNTVTNTLKAPAALAVHTIDAQPGQTITIKLQDQSQPIDSQLVDADGKLLSPIGKAVAGGATYTIYTLSGTAPYKVSFLPKGQYTIKLTKGNIYSTNLGAATFGAKIAAQLQPPAITGIYTLDTAPDQIISVLITSRGQPQFISGELRSGDGSLITPIERQYNGTNITAYVFRLTGPGPYQFAFQTTQPYEIQFTRGDLGRTQFDIYPTPTPTPTPAP